MHSLRIGRFADPPDPSDPMVRYSTVEKNERPVRPIPLFSSPDDACTTIDFRVLDRRYSSRGSAHAKSENKADTRYVPGIHAMPCCGDDPRRDQKTRTESPNGLIPKTLRGTQVAGRP